MGATGLVSYAYFAVSSHALSAGGYGRIALLWVAVFIAVSVLHRPIEQLAARTIAERQAREGDVAEGLRHAIRIQLALTAAFVAGALAARGPIEGGLFDGSATLYWILVATVVAYSGSYLARGVLAARGRFRDYGGLLLLESCTRFGFAVAVAVGLAAGAIDPGLSPAEPPASTGASGRHAGGLVVVMACEQAFLNAGPVLVSITEGAAGAALAGFAFNALLIARAPLQLFQAVQASILPHLTRLGARGREEPFRRGVAATLAAIAGFSAIVTAVLVAVGPAVMDVLFGGGFDYSRGGLALMGAGMGLYLAGATLTQAAVARGRAVEASLRWVVAAVAFLLVLVLPEFEDPVLGVEVAFTGGAAVLAVLLYALYRGGAPRRSSRAWRTRRG